MAFDAGAGIIMRWYARRSDGSGAIISLLVTLEVGIWTLVADIVAVGPVVIWGRCDT
jgi:hypothetical protein